MNRKQFIESQGATCKNWNWSWSFINEKEKVIIFGAWEDTEQGNRVKILSKDWKISDKGKNLSGYNEALEHIRLVEEKGYKLKTFPMIYSDEKVDENGLGPAKIGDFSPILTEKILQREEDNWYAYDMVNNITIPEEVYNPQVYIEGASKEISVNAYERNPDARKKCIDHYGYECAVCAFNFEKVYGEIGKEYIHVHHIKPLGELKKEYEVDPVKDLIPVCPNCHAMIHRTQTAMPIKLLQKNIRSR